MATLYVYDYWEVETGGRKHSGGSRSAPVELTATVIEDRTISLATATTLDLWSSAGAITSFVFFWLKADYDLRIELTVDRGNEVGDEVIALLIEANTPFRIIYDDALAGYTVNFAAGTEDVIDRIRLRNVSGSTATIQYCLAG